MTILDLKSIGSLAIMFVIDLVDIGRIETAVSCFFVLAYNLHRYVDYLRAKSNDDSQKIVYKDRKTVSPYVFISIFLLILLVLSLLTSCGSSKATDKKETAIETNAEQITQVNKELEINRGINDLFAYQFPQLRSGDKKCDSISNILLKQILKSINTKKTSGDNSYSLKYNELTKQLELLVTVAETTNNRIDSISANTLTVYKTEYREKPVRLPMRWYEKAFCVIGITALLILLVYIVFRIKRASI